MGQALGEYGAHIAAMLLGGLAPTVGLTLLARSARGRAALARARGWALAVGAVVAVALGGGAGYWMVRRMIGAAGGAEAFPAPIVLVGFGLAIGLPLALPAVVIAWSDERARARARSKRKDRVATKDDRRAYAGDLERQIRELSSPPREVEVSVGGDGDRVLRIAGPLEADEGERLTRALAADLRDLGFKRVEGTGGKKEWWARV